MNIASTVLALATRSSKIGLENDITKILTQAGNGHSGKPSISSFYRNVFAYGDCAVLKRKSDGTKVFGASLDDILSGNKDVIFVPNKYNVLCDHLSQSRVNQELSTDGKVAMSDDLSPENVLQMVADVATHETIPPWNTKTWKDVCKNFMPCKSHREPSDVGQEEDMVKVAFAHQRLGEGCKDTEVIVETISGILSGNKTPDWTTKVFGGDLAKIVDEAFQQENFSGMVCKHKIFTCMESTITVCWIKKENLGKLSDGLIKWYKAMVMAQQLSSHTRL